jgi:hypothetical protein
MARRRRVPKNWDRILANRRERQQQAIRELQSADDETRVLAVHQLCPCRPGNLELFVLYLYPLRHDPSTRVRQAVNEAFNEGLERIRVRDRRASRELVEEMSRRWPSSR